MLCHYKHCAYAANTGRPDEYIHVYISNPIHMQNGNSPLYIACALGHTEVVDVLLNNGADPKLATMVWRLVCLSKSKTLKM